MQTQDDAAERRTRSRTLEHLRRQAGQLAWDRALWRTYRVTCDQQQRVLDACQEWARTFPQRQDARESLVLWGAVGTGKDHLALAACRQVVIQWGATAQWVNGRDLMGKVRDTISEGSKESNLLRVYATSQILVLSDPLPPFGNLTNHQADLLYRLIRWRVDYGRLTIVTINGSSQGEIEDAMGVPTWDRIQQGAWLIHCDWPSHRKPARRIP